MTDHAPTLYRISNTMAPVTAAFFAAAATLCAVHPTLEIQAATAALFYENGLHGIPMFFSMKYSGDRTAKDEGGIIFCAIVATACAVAIATAGAHFFPKHWQKNLHPQNSSQTPAYPAPPIQAALAAARLG